MVKQTKLCYLKFTSIFNKCILLLLGEKDKPEKHNYAEKGDKLMKKSVDVNTFLIFIYFLILNIISTQTREYNLHKDIPCFPNQYFF